MQVPLILSMTSVIHSTEWLLWFPAQETYSCLSLASHCPIRTTFTSPLMILILLYHKSHILQPLLPATIGSQVEELLLGLLGGCHFGGSLPTGYLFYQTQFLFIILRKTTPFFPCEDHRFSFPQSEFCSPSEDYCKPLARLQTGLLWA